MNEGRRNRSLVEFSRLFADDERFDRDERIEVLKRLIPDQDRKWLVRFFLMLTLSVTIAVMGLAANSVAVVIGAMLIAPLMTPIMSFRLRSVSGSVDARFRPRCCWHRLTVVTRVFDRALSLVAEP